MALNITSILDIFACNYTANCSFALPWLQSTRYGPANFSNPTINTDFLRSALPTSYNGSSDHDIGSMYEDLATILYPAGSNWYANATSTAWKHCCDPGPQDKATDHSSTRNATTTATEAGCKTFDLDLSEFDFTRDCTLTGQWLYSTSNDKTDELKRTDEYDYGIFLPPLTLRLLKSAWPRESDVLTGPQISLWLNAETALNSTYLSKTVGGSALNGSCARAICKMQELNGSADLAGIGVRSL